MEYRKEIDGLRAISVLSVILYHAGFGGFSGGYVGVDVFFVISGFLITSIILEETKRGAFSILHFYERRIRRIIPALLTVVFFTIPFAWFWLLPQDLESYSGSLLSVALFASNFFFWQDSGYFTTASEFKPLLHTWSLAVEEQFYIVFPLLIMVLGKLRNNKLLAVFGGIALISFALTLWSVNRYPAFNFFLLPTRAWELMVGVLLAFKLSGNIRAIGQIKSNNLLAEAFALLGLSLIAGAVFLFDQTTPFPSVYSLFPVIGAAFVIVFASPFTVIGRILSHPFLVGLGLISYSAYLWHQPVFAFARYRFSSELDHNTLLGLVTFVFYLSFLSWKYIEVPFRRGNFVTKRKLLSFVSLGVSLLVTVGLVGYLSKGYSSRLSSAQLELMDYKFYPRQKVYREGVCFLGPNQNSQSFSRECVENRRDAQSIMIWGDSHSAALSYGIRREFENTLQLTASGCPPIIGFENPTRVHCGNINQYVLEEIKRIKPERLIMHADWLYVLRFTDVVDLSNTLALVRRASPDTQVFVLGGVPQWQPDLPVVLLRNSVSMIDSEVVDISMMLKQQILKVDSDIAANLDDEAVRFVSLLQFFCNQDNKCIAFKEYENQVMPVIWDYGHLTENGSLYLAEQIRDVIVAE